MKILAYVVFVAGMVSLASGFFPLQVLGLGIFIAAFIYSFIGPKQKIREDEADIIDIDMVGRVRGEIRQKARNNETKIIRSSSSDKDWMKSTNEGSLFTYRSVDPSIVEKMPNETVTFVDIKIINLVIIRMDELIVWFRKFLVRR